MGDQQRQVGIIDLIISYVSLVSILNVILLSVGYFYPLLSLLFSLIVLILFVLIFKIKVVKKVSKFPWILIGILVITLLLRLNPNLYLTGGQDQGTYVSLSKQYEINHSLYLTDKLRDSFSESLKKLYDNGNVFLGIEMKDEQTSEYVMPFYPVFPSWMSVSSDLLGSDNRVYALTFFSILSVISVYLFSYEISGRDKKIALLSAFLVAINPLHVYFSRVPLTEVVSSTFFFFFFYYLVRFYNDYKEGKINPIYLIISLLVANALFYTRMSALLVLPIIILLPIGAYMLKKDHNLTKYLCRYSIIWGSLLAVSYIYYSIFIPELFSSILQGRILNILNTKLLLILLVIFLIVAGIFLFIKKFRKLLSQIIHLIRKYIFFIAIFVFLALIAYELYFYINNIFIIGKFSFFSTESLSYFKQLNFVATFLYLSPIGFVLLPISFWYFRRTNDAKLQIVAILLMIFLIAYWGFSRLSPYHYYFVRYQLSELIPLCLIFLSIFFISISKKTLGKILSICFIVLTTGYFGYFSLLQLRDYEGANKEVFEDLQTIVKKNDLLLVANNNFGSAQQITFPIKYYYGVNTFPMYTSTYIDMVEVQALKEDYENVYILMVDPNFAQDRIKLVKEIDFKHNYFVHCNREKDAYFEMSGHSKDIPFCKYIVIPNRYYYGTYKMYLYSWE